MGSEADMADIEYTNGVYTGNVYAGTGFAGNAITSDDPEGVNPQEVQPAQRGADVNSAVTVLGAMLSLALVVGVGIWGYRLMVRDVSGVPVVRALDGPMRIQPADPGGRPADHQGLAVNTVAAQGIAAAPADRLILAPRPVELTDEDAPMGKIKPVTPVSVDEPAAEKNPVFTTDATDRPTEELIDASLTATVAPLSGEVPLPVSATPADAARIVQPEPLNAAEPDSAATTTVDLAVLNAPGLKRSLRPQARPARDVADAGNTTLEAAINAAVETAASLDVDPASLAAGTRLAQLGAYDTPEIARAEWDRLYGRFGDYLDGKKRVIQQATSGGRTFYRLRAMGFDDLSDARRFCSALVSENADCIPVTTR